MKRLIPTILFLLACAPESGLTEEEKKRRRVPIYHAELVKHIETEGVGSMMQFYRITWKSGDVWTCASSPGWEGGMPCDIKRSTK